MGQLLFSKGSLRPIRTYLAEIQKVDIFATICTYWAEVLKAPQLVRTNSGKYVHFLYLGPIRTNESQRAFNEQKLPQMIVLGLFRWKQTFSQNEAKFRLIEGLLVPQPSTYE